jgi:glycosyltransferase involved in cell wall biosynthesis
MKPVLLYITHGFPVCKEEVFARDEFPFLRRKDWNIVVLPRLGDITRPYVCDCDAEVDDALLGHKIEKAAQLFRPSAWRMIEQEYTDHLLHGQKPILKPLLRATGIALQAERAVRQVLTTRNVFRMPIVAYSFWFSDAVVGICNLRRHFPHLRVVTRVNGDDLFPDQHEHGYLPLRYQRIALPDVVVAVSRAGLRQLREDGYPEEKTALYPLGVPAPVGFSRPAPKDRLVIASCATMVPIKRLDLLITSLKHLSLAQPERLIHWHHIGDGECRCALEENAARLLGPLKNVTWIFHGWLAVDAVRRFFASEPLDAMVSVSASEGGVPVSLQEAAACGIPLVATDAGGSCEIVVPETGILLPINFTEQEFITAMNTVMDWKQSKDRKEIADFCAARYSSESNYTCFVNNVLERQMAISGYLLEKPSESLGREVS